MLSACPTPAPKPPPPPYNEQIDVTGGVVWLGFGRDLTLRDLFFQGLTTGNSDFTNKAPGCRSFRDDDFSAIAGALTDYHNQLVTKASSIAPADDLVQKWVSKPAKTPSYRVSFVSDELATDGGLNLTFASAASAKAGESTSNKAVDIVLASSVEELALATTARDCVRANICLRSNNRGGTYIDAVIYGTLMRLKLKSASYKVDAEAKGSIGENYRSQIAFDLSTENISIAGGIIGTIRSSDRIKQLYDVPEIIEDLKNKRILSVFEKLRERTDSYGIIGAAIGSVSAEDCARLVVPPK